MTRIIRPALVSTVLVVLGPAAAGPRGQQGPPPAEEQQPSQPTPIFRTGVSLVRVDASVTDRQGRPVEDLAVEDFEIREDGVPQAIESFRFVQLDGQPGPEDQDSLQIRSPDHAEAVAARDDIRLFAIFLDDYHVSRGRSTLIVREALTRFVYDELGPTDLVVLMDPLTPLSALEFTRDRDEIVRRIQAFEGRRGIYLPPRSVIEEQQLGTRSIERVRSEVSLSAVTALVTKLGSLREGRKSVLLVSEGFPGSQIDIMRALRETHVAANRNNAAIYPIDPRGLTERYASDQHTLRVLADTTDGRAILNTNRVEDRLSQIVRDASGYYLLGYSPSRSEPDDRFHEIEVHVKRPGTDVRARHGYWASPMPEATLTVETDAEREVREALEPLSTQHGGWSIATWVGTALGRNGAPAVTFAWEPAAPAPGFERAVPARVLLEATGPDGRVLFDGPVPVPPGTNGDTPPPAGAVGFDAVPGPLQLRVRVEDAETNVIDTLTLHHEVSDVSEEPVVLSTPRLVRARTAYEFRQLLHDVHALPTTRRAFGRGERVLVRVEAASRQGRPIDLTIDLLNKDARPLAPLPVTRLEDAAAVHQAEIPVVSLGEGEYLIQIQAQAEDHRTHRLLAFRVER